MKITNKNNGAYFLSIIYLIDQGFKLKNALYSLGNQRIFVKHIEHVGVCVVVVIIIILNVIMTVTTAVTILKTAVAKVIMSLVISIILH